MTKLSKLFLPSSYVYISKNIKSKKSTKIFVTILNTSGIFDNINLKAFNTFIVLLISFVFCKKKILQFNFSIFLHFLNFVLNKVNKLVRFKLMLHIYFFGNLYLCNGWNGQRPLARLTFVVPVWDWIRFFEMRISNYFWYKSP